MLGFRVKTKSGRRVRRKSPRTRFLNNPVRKRRRRKVVSRRSNPTRRRRVSRRRRNTWPKAHIRHVRAAKKGIRRRKARLAAARRIRKRTKARVKGKRGKGARYNRRRTTARKGGRRKGKRSKLSSYRKRLARVAVAGARAYKKRRGRRFTIAAGTPTNKVGSAALRLKLGRGLGDYKWKGNPRRKKKSMKRRKSARRRRGGSRYRRNSFALPSVNGFVGEIKSFFTDKANIKIFAIGAVGGIATKIVAAKVSEFVAPYLPGAVAQHAGIVGKVITGASAVGVAHFAGKQFGPGAKQAILISVGIALATDVIAGLIGQFAPGLAPFLSGYGDVSMGVGSWSGPELGLQGYSSPDVGMGEMDPMAMASGMVAF